METLVDLFKKSGILHHAYVLQGQVEQLREQLFEFVSQTLKHEIQGNPDFWHQRFETLSVDDARSLRELQLRKAFGENRKVFVIEMLNATVEAQNALLKVFEEPTPQTHFFVLMPSVDMLLPTLRSRVQIFKTEFDSSQKKAKDFLQLSPAERLAGVSEIIENKDKAAALDLVQNLIVVLGKDAAKHSASLQELFTVRTYLNDRSASLKLLLEHLCLSI